MLYPHNKGIKMQNASVAPRTPPEIRTAGSTVERLFYLSDFPSDGTPAPCPDIPFLGGAGARANANEQLVISNDQLCRK